MKIRLIITIVLFCSSILLKGQDNGIRIVEFITMNDGSILKGEVIEESDFFVKIKSEEFGYRLEKSNIVNREKAITVLSKKKKERGPFVFQEEGYRYSFSVYSLTSKSSSSQGLSLTAHKYWNYRLALGLGIGYDSYNFFSREKIVPIFADIKSHLLKKTLSPFIGASLGYGIALKEDFIMESAIGGYYFSPYIGIEKRNRSRFSFSLFVGYKFQKANYELRDFISNSTFENDVTFRRFIGGVKFSF